MGIVLWRRWPPTDAASQFPFNQYFCYWVPATRHCGPTFANLQCGASSSAMFTNHHCAPSPSATFTNQVCAPSTSAPFTNLQCAPHQVRCSLISTMRLLQVVVNSARVAPIFTVAFLQLHRSTVNLHLLATILCDYATRQLCDYVIMPLVSVLHYQQSCYRCEYALSTI